MEIEFTSGKAYQYYFVPASVYEALLSADSKGRFVNSRIKNVFPHTLLAEEERDGSSGAPR